MATDPNSDKTPKRRQTMDMREHEETWTGFMRVFAIASLGIAAATAFLILWQALGWSVLGSMFTVIVGAAVIAFFFS